MNHEEYVKRVLELEQQLMDVTQQYVQSEQIYKEGDYLLVTFPRSGETIQRTCKIMNVYPQNTGGQIGSSFGRHPKGELEYFARYVWKRDARDITIGDKTFKSNDEIAIGDVCYLGPLSHSSIICGYMGIDWKDVKIEVIDESKILSVNWK